MAHTEPTEADSVTVRRHGRTTIILTRDDRGEWRATQRGVDVAGTGETAATAAAAYCRRVDERDG